MSGKILVGRKPKKISFKNFHLKFSFKNPMVRARSQNFHLKIDFFHIKSERLLI